MLLLSNRTVTFTWTLANILSGGFDDCLDAQDDSCQGGFAGVDAFRRYYALEPDEPSLIIPRLDFQTPFVQMHPLSWTVNLIVMKHRFGWETYFSEPTHYYENQLEDKGFVRDVGNLRSFYTRPLLSNMDIGASNRWKGFVKDVHFDQRTGLAVMVVYDPAQAQVVEVDAAISTHHYIKRLLQKIELRNKEDRCLPYEPLFESYVNASTSNDDSSCWIPVVVYDYISEKAFQEFVEEMRNYEFPPSLIIDTSGNNETYRVPRQVGAEGMWVLSYQPLSNSFDQQRIHISENGRTISNISILHEEMSRIPNKIRDEKFSSDIDYLRGLADEAAQNDPVVGETKRMPVTIDGTLWYCLGGECSLANLFSDSLRWYGNTDIAVINSGGFRGPGWPAGEVRVSNLWEAFPYANTYCEARLSGLSIFRMLNYSTSVSLFKTQFTSTADRLLQVSGMRYTYNTELEESRLISVEIWDDESGQYQPLERLRIYSVSTVNYMCEAFRPFTNMFHEDLILEGEKEGQATATLIHDMVTAFLKALDTPYDTSIQGRLINDTAAQIPMDWIQTEATCSRGTYWMQRLLSCLPCPDTSNLTFFAEDSVHVVGQTESSTVHPIVVELSNPEDFPMIVQWKSGPPWVELDVGFLQPISLEPGDRTNFEFEVSAEALYPGSAKGKMLFSVRDGGSFPRCILKDTSFALQMTVEPLPELQKPSKVVISLGLFLSAIAILISCAFSVWVFRHAQVNLIKALQPEFLLTLCLGVVLFSASIIPYSLQDELASQLGRDILCMANVWLFNMGFMTIMSSLAVMMWRVNKLLGRRGALGLRRATFTRKHALVCFGVLIGANAVLLLGMTFVDPMTWEIGHALGDESIRFGHCAGHGTTGKTFYALSLALNILVLFTTVYMAYETRNISDQYSHSKTLGVAVFLGVQLSIVGLPCLFLIGDDSPDPQYFLQVLLIFTVGMSILSTILVPIMQKYRATLSNHAQSTSSRVHVTITPESGGSSLHNPENARPTDRGPDVSRKNYHVREELTYEPDTDILPEVVEIIQEYRKMVESKSSTDVDRAAGMYSITIIQEFRSSRPNDLNGDTPEESSDLASSNHTNSAASENNRNMDGVNEETTGETNTDGMKESSENNVSLLVHNNI